MAGRRRIIDDSDSDSEVMIVDNVDNNNNVGSKDKANSTATNAPQQQQNTKQSQAIHPQLQQKIYTEAGVQPSNYWLEKCLSHLRRKVRVSIVLSYECMCSIWSLKGLTTSFDLSMFPFDCLYKTHALT